MELEASLWSSGSLVGCYRGRFDQSHPIACLSCGPGVRSGKFSKKTVHLVALALFNWTLPLLSDILRILPSLNSSFFFRGCSLASTSSGFVMGVPQLWIAGEKEPHDLVILLIMVFVSRLAQGWSPSTAISSSYGLQVKQNHMILATL